MKIVRRMITKRAIQSNLAVLLPSWNPTRQLVQLGTSLQASALKCRIEVSMCEQKQRSTTIATIRARKLSGSRRAPEKAWIEPDEGKSGQVGASRGRIDQPTFSV